MAAPTTASWFALDANRSEHAGRLNESLTSSVERTTEQLHEQQHVTLILRLVVDRELHVVRGEVGGKGLESKGERWIAFRGPDNLLGAVQTWLGAE